jgi:hypothetical protein
MDTDYRVDLLQRLERIERKVNEVVRVVMLATALLCAFGAGAFISWIGGNLFGKTAGDIAGGIAGAIAFYASWLNLHKKIFDG